MNSCDTIVHKHPASSGEWLSLNGYEDHAVHAYNGVSPAWSIITVEMFRSYTCDSTNVAIKAII